MKKEFTMRQKLACLLGVTFWLLAQPVCAALNIFACTPEWGALAKELA